MINWIVRFKNRQFWLSFIPALLLLIQTAAALVGLELQLGPVGEGLLELVNALFAVLALLGVVTDPTTEGVSDSSRALGYTEPGGGE